VPVIVCKDTTTIYNCNYSNNQRIIQALWKKDGVIFKSVSKTDTLNVLTTNQSGTYIYETRYKGGCVSTSFPYKLTLGKIEVLLYETGANKSICEGASTSLYGGINHFLVVPLM
jgi:hypothetical protein